MAELVLAGRTFDITHRPLVMGILNRTPDSFTEKGRYFALDAMLARAEDFVADGADILDVGGVKAGPGPAVPVDEELERVVPAVDALANRFDCAVSVDTWNATVAKEAFAHGASLGNDISGFADPEYLPAAAAAGAGVVATHIRLAPRVADPDPHYGDVVAEVVARLSDLAREAVEAGVDRRGVIVDAGLDLGKNASQSRALLAGTDRLGALGYPVLVSASFKTFLGETLDLDVADRGAASLAAAAWGVARGARVVRVHDVRGTRRACDALAELDAAR